MPSQVPHSPRSIRTVLKVAAALLGGCAPATRGPAGSARVSAAGSTVTASVVRAVMRPVATALVEAQTVSFALDRIDQRDLPLDQTYRHYGTGSGVTVYVFDGGILDTHPELAGRVRRGYDAFPNEEHVCNAHGTAVAGAVAGTTLGVAPSVEIVDVKMVECRRMRGTIQAIVRGAQWTIADHARHPGRRAIANWSFIADTSASIPALDSAVASLRAAGIPVVVSAGNIEMNACRIAPANSPGAIVVGASRIRRVGLDPAAAVVDARTPGTAFGACLDVFAPGDSVLLPSMEGARQPTNQLWTGTSMSAGYVSGAIALYLQANPMATPEMVSEHIRTGSGATIVDPAHSPRTGLLYIGNERRTTVAAR
jgi:subtilisin family serine protease